MVPKETVTNQCCCSVEGALHETIQKIPTTFKIVYHIIKPSQILDRVPP